MNDEHQTILRDLQILETMVAETDGYLMSEATHWPMEKGDMPKLTIGGCLMRCHRLEVIRHRLDAADQSRLDMARHLFNQQLAKNVVRFENRMHQELRARLSDWSGYLRHMSSRMMADVVYYASVVDARVVMKAAIDELMKPSYQLDQRILDELATLDNNLKSRWLMGEFVWPPVWQPAYPLKAHWWLYGRPK